MKKMIKKNDGLDFIRERSQQIKQEIKERKQWKKGLIEVYCKARTTDIERKHIVKMVKVADKMVEHYENILAEHELMLKELEEMN